MKNLFGKRWRILILETVFATLPSLVAFIATPAWAGAGRYDSVSAGYREIVRAKSLKLSIAVRKKQFAQAATMIVKETGYLGEAPKPNWRIFAYEEKRAKVPSYDNHIRTPFLSKPYYENGPLLLLNMYIDIAELMPNTMLYQKFYLETIILNKYPVVNNLIGVIDTIIDRNSGGAGLALVVETIEEHFASYPDSQLFAYLDPFHKELLHALPRKLQIAMLKQFLYFNHSFISSEDYYSANYESMMNKLKSLLTDNEYGTELAAIVEKGKTSKTIDTFRTGAFKFVINEYIDFAINNPRLEAARYQTVFNDAFLGGSLFDLSYNGSTASLTALIKKIATLDKALAAKFVIEKLRRNPFNISGSNFIDDLVEPFIVRYNTDVPNNPFLKQLVTKVGAPLGTHAYQVIADYRERFFSQLKELPIDPHVVVPGTRLGGSRLTCNGFYQ